MEAAAATVNLGVLERVDYNGAHTGKAKNGFLRLVFEPGQKHFRRATMRQPLGIIDCAL